MECRKKYFLHYKNLSAISLYILNPFLNWYLIWFRCVFNTTWQIILFASSIWFQCKRLSIRNNCQCCNKIPLVWLRVMDCLALCKCNVYWLHYLEHVAFSPAVQAPVHFPYISGDCDRSHITALLCPRSQLSCSRQTVTIMLDYLIKHVFIGFKRNFFFDTF